MDGAELRREIDRLELQRKALLAQLAWLESKITKLTERKRRYELHAIKDTN